MTLKELSIDIYQYLDHRKLLKTYFESCREQDSKYSLRYFAQRLNFNSPNYIQKILLGDRKISEKTLDGLIKLLKLKGNEREYFELLVQMGQSQDLNRRNACHQSLLSLRGKKQTVNTLEEAQYACISSWLHWVVREMAFMRDFVVDAQWISKRLRVKVNPAIIEQCWKDLEMAELLVRKEGSLKPTMSSISFPEEVYSMALLNYHLGILEQARQALQQQKSTEREYGATLVATTTEKYQQFKEKLKKFRSEALELLDTPAGEATRVVNFSFQLFQVTEDEK
ncbi:TIGR02147 family protein [Deltaproteobacteria bacterium TL4]